MLTAKAVEVFALVKQESDRSECGVPDSPTPIFAQQIDWGHAQWF